jgi:tetratricopeptide (TPR) repeat protein
MNKPKNPLPRPILIPRCATAVVLLAAGATLAAPLPVAAGAPGLDTPQSEAPHEGLPTPDEFVRDALRHPPADPEKRAEVLDGLYTRLAAAPSADMAKAVAQAIERVWRTSGSATLDLLLARATAAIEQRRFDLAQSLLGSVLELQPDYAEAWNRRAFAFHLSDDQQRALADLRHVLALDPKHFRALEGMGLIMRTLGEKKAALAAYKKLLEVYPHFDGAAKIVEELSVEVEGQGI